jgi:aryl-alcohol dehydrogenase-like predicted oxidoreductase
MHFPNGNNARLSRLMLGTVQFGLPYGVANRTGQPEYREVIAIVEAAVAGGINCFDTAAAYGTSEEVLGRALTELGIADQVVVVTKVQALTPAQLSDPALATTTIVQSVERSRQRLQLDCLPIVLFHREPDAAFIDVVASLQAKKWLHHFGVSCDNRPGAAASFVASGRVSALQLPANILDHRHARSGIFESATAHDVAIFVRSVYLQGLLAMPEGDIPVSLREVIPARRKLEVISAEAGISLPELALRYMLSQRGATSILIGVETVQQVTDNLAMFTRGPLHENILAAVHLAVPQLSETLITPSLWPSRSAG